MAAADAVVVVVSPPPPEPVLGRQSAAVKVFMYLCLASLWVASAALAAATVARRAWGEASPVFKALVKTSIGGILITVLFIVLFYLRLLRAMCATGFGLSTWAKTIQHHARKVSHAVPSCD
uniref:Uncharacterized protein n=1 Tax=Arundo donax TaxID=35708 RepID=A0A0A9DYR0_ARUDO